jgi:vacuolar-type H+-ATPase subunit F/Vma7
MSNVAFIGESDLIKGLGMVGAGVFGIEKKEDLPSLLEGLVKQGCRVVFILEKWAKVAQDVIDAYRDKFISIVDLQSVYKKCHC